MRLSHYALVTFMATEEGRVPTCATTREMLCTFVVCLFLWSMNRSAAINACVSCGFLFAVLVVQRRKKSLCVCVWCVYKGTFVICRMC